MPTTHRRGGLVDATRARRGCQLGLCPRASRDHPGRVRGGRGRATGSNGPYRGLSGKPARTPLPRPWLSGTTSTLRERNRIEARRPLGLEIASNSLGGWPRDRYPTRPAGVGIIGTTRPRERLAGSAGVRRPPRLSRCSGRSADLPGRSMPSASVERAVAGSQDGGVRSMLPDRAWRFPHPRGSTLPADTPWSYLRGAARRPTRGGPARASSSSRRGAACVTPSDCARPLLTERTMVVGSHRTGRISRTPYRPACPCRPPSGSIPPGRRDGSISTSWSGEPSTVTRAACLGASAPGRSRLTTSQPRPMSARSPRRRTCSLEHSGHVAPGFGRAVAVGHGQAGLARTSPAAGPPHPCQRAATPGVKISSEPRGATARPVGTPCTGCRSDPG